MYVFKPKHQLITCSLSDTYSLKNIHFFFLIELMLLKFSWEFPVPRLQSSESCWWVDSWLGILSPGEALPTGSCSGGRRESRGGSGRLPAAGSSSGWSAGTEG